MRRPEPKRASPAVETAGGGSSLYRTCFAVSVALYLLVVFGLVASGGAFYATPVAERSLHPLYSLLKPSGTVGLSLGIAGTSMMLLIFLYPLRKRWTALQKIGTQAQWLQVHIFLGFAGPVLVTFHTTGKLAGAVAIAFYAMWAMVLSGVVGRYLYAKIPRTVKGNQMTLKEIEEQLGALVEALRQGERRQSVLAGIQEFLAGTRQVSGGLSYAVYRMVMDDLRLPLNALRVWWIVRRDGKLGLRRRYQITKLVLKQQRLLSRLAVLEATQRVFSFWHIFHKPFTVITFVIVSVHVAVALFLGYGLSW